MAKFCLSVASNDLVVICLLEEQLVLLGCALVTESNLCPAISWEVKIKRFN